MTQKACRICRELLPLGKFFIQPGDRTGFRNSCRECRLASHRAAYHAKRAKNPEAMRLREREYMRKYRAAEKGGV